MRRGTGKIAVVAVGAVVVAAWSFRKIGLNVPGLSS